jgi:hypothetical protein
MSRGREMIPGQGELDDPPDIHIGGVVERSGHRDGALHALKIPIVQRRPAVNIRLYEEQIEDRVQRVDLDLVVLPCIAVRIDEDFKIVIIKHDLIALGQRRPHMGLLQPGGDVEIFIVPEHLDPRIKPRAGQSRAADIHERLRPRCVQPRRIIQSTIDLDRIGCASAGIAHGMVIIPPRPSGARIVTGRCATGHDHQQHDRIKTPQHRNDPHHCGDFGPPPLLRADPVPIPHRRNPPPFSPRGRHHPDRSRPSAGGGRGSACP